MKARHVLASGPWAVAALVLLAPAAPAKPRQPEPGTVRIGVAGSFFRDISPALVLSMMEPFGGLMKAVTGIKGELVPAGDADDLGRRLHEGKVELGLFQGIEFAWAQQKYPDLRPLTVIVNRRAYERTLLLVRRSDGVGAPADLRGKVLAVPLFTREHCYDFLEGACGIRGKGRFDGFFGKVTRPETMEAALDDLVEGKAQAALVEDVPAECYHRRKPGRFSRLEVLRRSEPFPPSVIAYRAGGVDEETLRTFRDGMLNAPQMPVGRQLLMMWKVTGFLTVPDDYGECLTATAKAYPAPK